MLSRMAKERATSGWKAFFRIAPTLRAQYIPMLVRVNLIKAVLIPCLVWGGELWASGKSRCAEHQSIVNSAVKALFDLHPKGVSRSFGNATSIMMEFNIPPIHAILWKMRTRAFYKLPTLDTTIRKLSDTFVEDFLPKRGLKSNWFWETSQFLTSLEDFGDVIEGSEPSFVKTQIWEQFNRESTATSSGFKSFQDWEMNLSAKQLYPLWHKYHNDLRILSAMRCHIIPSIAHLQKATLVDIDGDKGTCPFCEQARPHDWVSDLSHVLFTCPKFAEVRARHNLSALAPKLSGLSGCQCLCPSVLLVVMCGGTVASEFPGATVVGDDGDERVLTDHIRDADFVANMEIQAATPQIPKNDEVRQSHKTEGDGFRKSWTPKCVLISRFMRDMLGLRNKLLQPFLANSERNLHPWFLRFSGAFARPMPLGRASLEMEVEEVEAMVPGGT